MTARLASGCWHPDPTAPTGLSSPARRPSSRVRSSKESALVELVDGLVKQDTRSSSSASSPRTLTWLTRRFGSIDGSGCGETPLHRGAGLVERFQSGEADVFLISLKAGGTSLHLTAATYVIHLDPWWNPAAEDQATDRAHRIGQDQPSPSTDCGGRHRGGWNPRHAGGQTEVVAGLLGGADQVRRLTSRPCGHCSQGRSTWIVCAVYGCSWVRSTKRATRRSAETG